MNNLSALLLCIKNVLDTEEAVFVKKIDILVSEYSEWSKTSRNIIFSWRPDACVCVCVCMCVYVCMCVCVYVLDFLIFKQL